MKGFNKRTLVISRTAAWLAVAAFGYLFVGNLSRGIGGVTLLGQKNAHFMGYYLLAGAYFIFFALSVIAAVLLTLKRK